MPHSGHQELIDKAMSWARMQLDICGRVDFTMFTIDEKGREKRTPADPQCFAGDGKRDRLARRMRERFQKAGVVRYAIVAECWLRQYPPPGQLAKVPAGRQEVIIVHVCDRRGSSVHVAAIERHPVSGLATELRILATMDDAETLMGGRFANLLEGQLH